MRYIKYTILTLLVALLLFLSMMAVPTLKAYRRHKIRYKEVVLQQQVHEMRLAIGFYHKEHKKKLNSLEDLVKNKYLKIIPFDPLTGSDQTWVLKYEVS